MSRLPIPTLGTLQVALEDLRAEVEELKRAPEHLHCALLYDAENKAKHEQRALFARERMTHFWSVIAWVGAREAEEKVQHAQCVAFARLASRVDETERLRAVLEAARHARNHPDKAWDIIYDAVEVFNRGPA